MISVLLLPLLAISAAACSENDSKRTVSAGGATTGEDEIPAVDDSVSIRLDREQIESGGSFTVTFERAADDTRTLVLGPGLGLRQGDQKLNTLVVRDVFSSQSELPASLPPDSPLPDRGLHGTGPFRFELPQTEKGEYQVCARVLFTGDDISPQEGDVCRDFIVV